MPKVLVLVGAALLICTGVFVAVCYSNIDSANKDAQNLAVTDDYLPGGEALGIDPGEPSTESLKAYSSIDAWTARRNFGWVLVAVSAIVLGAGVLAASTARKAPASASTATSPVPPPPPTAAQSAEQATSLSAGQSSEAEPLPLDPTTKATDQDSVSDIQRSLDRLEELRTAGTITDQEYTERRRQILDRI